MTILQKYLAVIYNSKDSESGYDANVRASEMIKELIAAIKTNQSTRIDGDLIYSIDSSEKYVLPKADEEEKQMTKWQKFALEKGIAPKKKSRMVFSEKFNKWLPRYGSRSEQNQILQGGAVEVEQSMSKMINEKKKRVLKNKKNQEKNKAL